MVGKAGQVVILCAYLIQFFNVILGFGFLPRIVGKDNQVVMLHSIQIFNVIQRFWLLASNSWQSSYASAIHFFCLIQRFWPLA
jgi:hypothetical protein